jgi:hypothetical protein
VRVLVWVKALHVTRRQQWTKAQRHWQRRAAGASLGRAGQAPPCPLKSRRAARRALALEPHWQCQGLGAPAGAGDPGCLSMSAAAGARHAPALSARGARWHFATSLLCRGIEAPAAGTSGSPGTGN